MSSTVFRSKPYESKSVTWDAILQRNLQIPMTQREYAWTGNELKKFLDDIFKLFDEGKYIYKMGSIIILQLEGCNDVYDGQQRTLTIIIFLHCLSLVEPKLRTKIKMLLTVDNELDDLTEQQQLIKDAYGVKTIPKIYCVFPPDTQALVDIFNGNADLFENNMEGRVSRIDPAERYELDGETGEDECDDKPLYPLYKCNVCAASGVSGGGLRKASIMRHMVACHNITSKCLESSSKLYDAYDYISTYIKNQKYDESRNIRLFKFIVGEIDIQLYDCNDSTYVSRIFDWENNRGLRVNSLDLVKNQILVKILPGKRAELYDIWTELKNKKCTAAQKINDYGEKLFDVGIQLYNNEVSRMCNHDDLFKPIIDAKDPYAEVRRFFATVEKLYSIMDEISNDRFGRLVTSSPKVKLTWEAYMWAMLPIFYKRGSIDTQLIKLLVKWYFRTSYVTSELTFNSMSYSNEFIRISNCYLKDDRYDYYDEIMRCLVKYMSSHVLNDYEVKLRDMELTNKTAAQYLLLFLETCETPDLQTVPLKYTLEHIIPQKAKQTLTSASLMNNIGNLTLLEGKNTKNVQKGNSSLGCKEYIKKIDSYKNSSCKITREIPETYVAAFTERDVQDRAKSIAFRMTQHTSY